MRLIIVAAAALTLTFSAAAEEPNAASADEVAITAAVLDYFHGQGQGSAERLNRAFAVEHAVMVGVMRAPDGAQSLRSWKDMREPIANWSKTPNPTAPDRDGEILDMHVVDNRIATVMFRSTDRFYDALTLVKIDGQWKIAAKVFAPQ